MKRVAAVLLAFVVPLAIYLPARHAGEHVRYERLQDERSELAMRVEMARAAQRKLVQFRSEKQQLDSELTRVTAMVPASIDTDGARSRIESAAAISGVRLAGFEPGPIQGTPEVQQQEIAVEMVGSAGGTAAFFTDLAHSGRLMFVSEMNVRTFGRDYLTRCYITVYALPKG